MQFFPSSVEVEVAARQHRNGWHGARREPALGVLARLIPTVQMSGFLYTELPELEPRKWRRRSVSAMQWLNYQSRTLLSLVPGCRVSKVQVQHSNRNVYWLPLGRRRTIEDLQWPWVVVMEVQKTLLGPADHSLPPSSLHATGHTPSSTGPRAELERIEQEARDLYGLSRPPSNKTRMAWREEGNRQPSNVITDRCGAIPSLGSSWV